MVNHVLIMITNKFIFFLFKQKSTSIALKLLNTKKNISHLFVVICFLFSTALHAQTTTVSYRFQSDSIVLSHRQTFSNKLIVHNGYQHNIILYNTTSAQDGMLVSLPDTIRMSAGEERSFPVKYLASADNGGMRRKRYSIVLQADKDVLINSQAFFNVLWNNDAPSILITPIEPIVYISDVIKTTSVKFRCVNKTDDDVSAVLTVQAVPQQGITYVPPQQTLSLRKGEEKIIEILVNKMNKMNKQSESSDFNLNVQAKGTSGEILALSTARIINITNDKRIGLPGDIMNKMPQNAIAATAVTGNASGNYYQLMGNGIIYSDSLRKLSYNATANYYQDKNYEVFDTWIAYDGKNVGVRAGNIYKNIDYALYGRGVELEGKLSKDKSISVGYIEHDYRLFTNIPNITTSRPQTWEMSYNSYGKNRSYDNITVLTTYDDYIKQRTWLGTLHNNYSLGKSTWLEVQAGASSEVMAQDSLSHKGFGAGFIFTTMNDKWNVSLNNYYGSPYYSGIRRGNQQWDERIGYNISPRANIFAHYNLTKNEPRFNSIIDTMPFNNNSSEIIEAGIQAQLSRHFSLTVHPYLFNQDISYTRDKQLLYFSSSYMRLAVDARYIKGSHSLYLTADYGYSVKEAEPGEQHSIRGILNYNNRYFGFTGIAQFNPYLITDEAFAIPGKRFQMYTFGPNVHLRAGKFDFGVFYNANYTTNYQTWNHTANAVARYNLASDCQVTGQFFYSSYIGQNFTQTRVTLAKQFISTKQPGRKQIELTFFADDNGNKIRDKNERVLEGIVCTVSDVMTSSDARGRVRYTNLPVGVYDVRIAAGSQYRLASDFTISVNKNDEYNVPLVMCGRVSGKLEVVQQKYQLSDVLLEGIRINAIDAQGHLFTTLTDAEGSFTFLLPEGAYTFDVKAPENVGVVNKGEKRTISQKQNEPLVFKVKNEGRKIDVIHF